MDEGVDVWQGKEVSADAVQLCQLVLSLRVPSLSVETRQRFRADSWSVKIDRRKGYLAETEESRSSSLVKSQSMYCCEEVQPFAPPRIGSGCGLAHFMYVQYVEYIYTVPDSLLGRQAGMCNWGDYSPKMSQQDAGGVRWYYEVSSTSLPPMYFLKYGVRQVRN
jgi:hypothetical protein